MTQLLRILTPEAEGGVGNVYADVVITNQKDMNLADEGVIPRNQVRSISLANVLVDTGATTLCLPRPLVEQLGLPTKDRIQATTAGGVIETEIFAQAFIEVLGRDGTVDCIALRDGSRPLLGVIPLEIMGLQPDVVHHRLNVLPHDATGTYINI
jgi:clan AA aspartic protease